MYTVNKIADWFLSQVNSDAGDSITPLKLQKLVYYAQAWHYTLFDTPLFEEEIQAWAHGPAVHSLYRRFESYARFQAINISALEITPTVFEAHTNELLNEIQALYGEHSGDYLEKLTHSETPWIEARGQISPQARCTTPISLNSMKVFYSKLNESKKENQ